MAGITGRKKGGGSGRVAREAPNTLKSRQVARVIDVISEGEIEGLVNGSQSVYFDDTPAENADGTSNFNGINYEVKFGEPDQTALKEWRGQEAVVSVGAEATNGSPVTRQITDTDCDFIDVALRLPTLTLQDNETGDLNGNSVRIKWEVAVGSGAFQTVHDTTIRGKCVAPYIRTFQIDLRALSATGPYNVRLTRVDADATETRDQRTTFFDSYTKVTQAKIKYNDSALMGVKVDAKQFGTKVPTRSYEIKGIKISVPVNYNQNTRLYNGVWNGLFKTVYSNNPAWCIYDLISNKRYGLGDYIDEAALDKYSFYEVAKYCDQLVPKGAAPITSANALTAVGTTSYVITVHYPAHGLTVGDGVLLTGGTAGRGFTAAQINNVAHTVQGVVDADNFTINFFQQPTSSGTFGGSSLQLKLLEPRFTMNAVISSRQEAFAVLQTMASLFHGMLYFGAGVLVPAIDKAKDPVKLVSPANVKDGIFTYGGTNLKSRHSICMARWNDPKNDYRPAVETYEDLDLRERFGYRTLEIAAFGCTSRGQARRHAKWTLETEKLGETVTYTAGVDHGDLNPADIISISDPVYSGTRWGGRITAVNAARTQVTLDDGITSEFNLSAKTYTISAVLSDGSIQERTISAVATVSGKTRVTVSAAFASGIEIGAMFVIHGDAEERLWQVLNVSQKDNEFDVVAVRHDPNKFATVDDIGYIDGDDDAYIDVPTLDSAAGSLSVTAREYNYIASGTLKSRVMVSWQVSSSPLVTGYQVFMTNNAGTYDTFETTTNSIEVSDIKVGTYTFDVIALSETGPTRITGSVSGFSVLGKLLPPDAPTALAVTNGLGVVDLAWTNPTDVDLSYIEVWKSDANDRNHSSAAVIKRTTSDKISIQLPIGTYYFWVRAVDTSTNPSDNYEPAGATAGVVGKSVSVSSQGTTLPAVADALEGQFFFKTDTQRMYAFNGTAWVIFANDIDNTSDLTDGANLGGSAVWQNVSDDGTGTIPANNATNNPVTSGANNPTTNLVTGAFFYNTTEDKLYTYDGSAWVVYANAFDNTNQLTDGANLGDTATWQNVTDDGTGTIPANNATNNPVSEGATNPTTGLVTGAFFYNTSDSKLYTYNGTAWVVYANSFDNTNDLTDGANLGGTAVWQNVSDNGDGTIPANNATNNPTASGATDPATAVTGEFFFNTTDNKLKVWNGTAWVLFGNAFDNTNQLTDGANLGETATWSSVTGTGVPANYATNNPVNSGTTNPTGNQITGAFFFNTSNNQLYTYNGTAWVVFANAFNNTNQLTDGAGLGDSADWNSINNVPDFGDLATADAGNGLTITSGGVASINTDGGSLILGTNGIKLNAVDGSQTTVSNFGSDLITGDVSKIAITRAPTNVTRSTVLYQTTNMDWTFWAGEVPARTNSDTHIPFADLTGVASTTLSTAHFVQIELQMKNPNTVTTSQSLTATAAAFSVMGSQFNFLSASGDKTAIAQTGANMTTGGNSYQVVSSTYNVPGNTTTIYLNTMAGLSTGTSYTFTVAPSSGFVVVGTGGFYSHGANQFNGWAVSGGMAAATDNKTELALVLTRRTAPNGALIYGPATDTVYEVSGELGGLR